MNRVEHLETVSPDDWNPADECFARRPAPRIIGGPSHTHVCRKPADHLDVPVAVEHEPDVRVHQCGCGHTW